MTLSSLEQIRSSIFESLKKESVICVFPTEIAARFWREEFVRKSGVEVVLSDRLIAWDKFRVLFYPKVELESITQYGRSLFALQLLMQNSFTEQLRYFRYPSEYENPLHFSSTIIQIIKILGVLKKEELPASYLSDLLLIERAYLQFLQERTLYDPYLQTPSLDHLPSEAKHEYHLYFYEVYEGWYQFENLQQLPAWISLFTLSSPIDKVPLYTFENELMEIRHTLTSIRKLLEKGVLPHSIVVSVADIASWRPYLLKEASLETLPLTIVEPRALTTYPAGRFFQSLLDLYNTNFSWQKMQSLFLDLQIGWADIDLHRTLIQKGILYSITHGSRVSKKEDQWIVKLSKSSKEGDKELLHWYEKTRETILQIVRAATFSDLSVALFTLIDHLLSDTKWDESQAEIFSYILFQFTQLQKALLQSKTTSLVGLYQFFVQQLAQQTYIEGHKGESIPLYPYKVAVGIAPQYHFILGCSLETTTVPPLCPPLLAEYQSKSEIEKERTELFFNHYALSSDTPLFSYSKVTFANRASLEPPWFSMHANKERVEYKRESYEAVEREAWKKDTPAPFTPSERESRAFSLAQNSATTFAQVDMATSDPLFFLEPYLLKKGDAILLSSTQLDQFTECPFKWAANYLLSLKEGPYDRLELDHRYIGVLLHSILEQFFIYVDSTTKLYRQEEVDTYANMLEKIMDEVFNSYKRSILSPPSYTLNYIVNRFSEQLRLIVVKEAATFEGFKSIGFEKKIELLSGDKKLFFEGRIDRIAESENKEVAVIDYKKSFSSSKKKYLESKELPSHQLPFYAMLLRLSEHKEVDIGSFYDINKGRYHHIWNKTESEFKELFIQKVEESIEKFITKLEKGVLGATPSKKACTHCDYRQVCRRRYSLI